MQKSYWFVQGLCGKNTRLPESECPGENIEMVRVCENLEPEPLWAGDPEIERLETHISSGFLDPEETMKAEDELEKLKGAYTWQKE